MTSLPDVVLAESVFARNYQTTSLNNEEAIELLCKAKQIIFTPWKGEVVCTTEQLAKYYECSVSAIKDLVSDYRNEFKSDGVRVIKGRVLKEFVLIFSLSSRISILTVWTPKAALRVGLYLQISPVSFKIRDLLGIPVACSLTFKEADIEKFASKEFGGQRQKRLLSQKRIDICDGVLVWEVKRGQITARHVGQLFEYLHETGLREGRLVGASFSSDAKAMIKILRKDGYTVEIYLYNR